MRSLYFFFCVSLWSSQSCSHLLAQSGAADRFLSAASVEVEKDRPQTTMARPTAVHFEPNMGQVKGRTEWMAQARGASVYITGPEVVFALGNDNAHMKFTGARPAKGAGVDPLGGYSNYFLGNTEKSWFTGIPHYGSVWYANVYPGIDVVYHSADGNVEYDFVLAPGADPNQIELAFDRDVRIGEEGDLILAGLRQHRPRVTQDGREIASEYRLVSPRRIHINLAHYGRTTPLTIDPTLEFSTYLGGPGYESFNVHLDPAGNIFLHGVTQTPASASLDPFQQTNLALQQGAIVKMTPDARHVLFFSVFATGYGGVSAIGWDSAGNIVIAGGTTSSAFPLKNPIQNSFNTQDSTGFIAKLQPDGRTLIFSTFLGGSAGGGMGALRVDTDDSIYVRGNTSSPDFPTKNAFQSQLGGVGDCTVSKITSSGSLVFSTYLGSSGWDQCGGDLGIFKDGTLVIAGATSTTEFPLVNPIQTGSNPVPYWSPFLVKMNKDGQSLKYSTYLGGDNFMGSYISMATDPDENIYVFGRAFNAFLELKNPFQSLWPSDFTGFLIKLDPTGRNIAYSTYFPMYGGVMADKNQNVYITGFTWTPDFPLKDSIRPLTNVNAHYAFLTKLAPNGQSMIYSTVFAPGWTLGVAVDAGGNAIVSGQTNGTDFPLVNAYQPKYGGGGDAFVAKVVDTSAGDAAPLAASPARIAFQYLQNGPAPALQSVAVTGPEQYFLTTNTTWLSAQPTGSPTPPNNIQVSVNAGNLAAGTYAGVVTIHPQSGAAVTTIDAALTVYAPPAMITSIDPSLVPIGSDDTLITIRGSAFQAGSLVYQNGDLWTVTPVTVVDAHTITFKIPKLYFSGEISYPFTVLNPLSVQSNSLAVSVGNPAPAFTAAGVLNAASYAPAPVSVGEIVIVFGSNFGSIDTTKVLFDSNPAKIIYLTPTQLAATVPVTAGNGQTTALQVQTSHDVYSAPVSCPSPLQRRDSSPRMRRAKDRLRPSTRTTL